MDLTSLELSVCGCPLYGVFFRLQWSFSLEMIFDQEKIPGERPGKGDSEFFGDTFQYLVELVRLAVMKIMIYRQHGKSL